MTETAGNHFKARPPNKEKQIVHFSQSGHSKAFANTIGDLRRSGFVWPPAETDPFYVSPASPSVEPDLLYAVEWVAKAAREASLFETKVLKDAIEVAKQDVEKEKTVDDLFTELKAAREASLFATEVLKDAIEALVSAQRAVETATQEKRLADDDLKKKKEAFTVAFDAGAV